MQHGYSYYHDTEYDNYNLNNKHRFNGGSRTSIISSRTSPNPPEQPCWKQRKSKLSRLKNRRNAVVVAAINSEQTAFLNTISRNGERNRGVGFVVDGAEARGDSNPTLNSATSLASDISGINDSLSVLNLGDVDINGCDISNNNENDKSHRVWEMNNQNQGHSKV